MIIVDGTQRLTQLLLLFDLAQSHIGPAKKKAASSKSKTTKSDDAPEFHAAFSSELLQLTIRGYVIPASLNWTKTALSKIAELSNAHRNQAVVKDEPVRMVRESIIMHSRTWLMYEILVFLLFLFLFLFFFFCFLVFFLQLKNMSTAVIDYHTENAKPSLEGMAQFGPINDVLSQLTKSQSIPEKALLLEVRFVLLFIFNLVSFDLNSLPQ
jgi:hypothetical protein